MYLSSSCGLLSRSKEFWYLFFISGGKKCLSSDLFFPSKNVFKRRIGKDKRGKNPIIWHSSVKEENPVLTTAPETKFPLKTLGKMDIYFYFGL